MIITNIIWGYMQNTTTYLRLDQESGICYTKNEEYSLEHQEYLLNHFEKSKKFKNEIFEQKNTMTELLDNFDNYLLDDLIKG